MPNLQGYDSFRQIPGAAWNLFNCWCLSGRPGQNAKLSVEETLPDPRYVLLQNEEPRDRLLCYEIQANQAVRFPGAFANCLMQCLRVFRCCHRHHSDHNVPLSVEELEKGTVYCEALVCE